MEEQWFAYAVGTLSMSAVRSANAVDGGEEEAHMEKVRNRNHHLKTFPVFRVSLPVAQALYRSIHDGGEPLTVRFFRRTANCSVPFEQEPVNRRSPKVEATKRAIRAIQKRK